MRCCFCRLLQNLPMTCPMVCAEAHALLFRRTKYTYRFKQQKDVKGGCRLAHTVEVYGSHSMT